MRKDASVNLETIAESTEGFTGSQLKSLCQEAALQCLREGMTISFDVDTDDGKLD